MKTTRSITINPEVWNSAKKLGINISAEIEKYLEKITHFDIKLLSCISYCKLCNQQKKIEDMIKITIPTYVGDDVPPVPKNEAGDDLVVENFICKECFVDINHNRLSKFDKKTLKPILETIKRDNEDLQEQRTNLETIEEVRRGEIKFTSPFASAIGVYDSDDFDEQSNSIKTLIENIKKEHPLADWTIKPGEITVPAKDIYENYENSD